MANEMDNLLDAFLYETNSLLDNLERILMQDEALENLSAEDINEIFRIMHTTKSSSAMMGYNSVSLAAHRIEDLFSFIRDQNDGLNFLDSAVKKDLFNLLFSAEDYLRTQMLHIENGEPLDENNSGLINAIEGMIAAIKGEPIPVPQAASAPAKNSSSQGEGTPASAESSVASAIPAATSASSEASATSASSNTLLPIPAEALGIELPADNNAQVYIHVMLQKNIMMENLRAFMIVTALQSSDLAFRYYPSDMDSNNDTCQQIIDHGFFLALDHADQVQLAADLLREQTYVDSFQAVAPADTVDVAIDEDPIADEIAQAAEAEALAATEAAEHAAQSGAHSGAQTASGANAVHKANAANGPVKQNLISVNLQKLDQLNNLVGEIIITESMVTSQSILNQLPQDQLDDFLKSARQLRKLTNELQDISMSLRMIPISGVFQKMTRVVRDMKQKLNKPVKLTLVGEETEVDKSIIDAIQDPILHLIRNCMDHGIEKTVQERIDADKPEEGQITISAENTSSEIVITVSDDGYGMDAEKILDKAERKGLLTKSRERYTRAEALNFILLPGFSTNSEVTEYSGRGVGMDVVRRNVEAIGGSLGISSEQGQGTTFTFHIPLTLSIIDGMKITVGDTVFTVSIGNIRQTFKAEEADIHRDEHGNPMVCRQGIFYPIIRLDEYFQLQGKKQELTDGILLWVEAYGKEFCLFADELIGQQQVVVKPLPQYLVNFNLKNHGISGCTILGDGEISIILDVPSLYNSAFQSDNEGEN